jgi:deazaflavin-dependent oxidoreductase (nitroreductase family)
VTAHRTPPLEGAGADRSAILCARGRRVNTLAPVRRYSELRGRRLTAYEATVEALAASRAGSWAFRRLVAPLDRRSRASVSRALRVPVGVLETTGARTGRPRRTALLYHRDGAALVLVASNYGGARDPAWLRNVRAHAHVRFAGREYTARVAGPAERARRWPRATDFYAGYAAYAQRTRREIALVILEPRQP